jgi:Mg2+/Co2+ transporter CorB
MTSLIFIFAEVLPKIYAIRKPDTLLIIYTPLLIFFVWLLSPINYLIQKLIDFLLNFKKIKSNNINLDRIRGAILLAAKEGEMIKDNRFMLESILDLKDREISEVMIHRKDIFSVNIDEKKEYFINLANKTPYSRFPVWKNNSENIIGVIYVKDLLRSLLNNKFNIGKVLQEPWFIPETTSLLGQLNAFREKQKQMAFAVDEYGVLQGLVTLEDILEEIVGQIEDEHDYPSSSFTLDKNGNIYVTGNVSLRDLNRKFNFKLPESSASTIAGLIINTAKRIPETGESFIIKSLILTVISRSQTRITKILIKKKTKP